MDNVLMPEMSTPGFEKYVTWPDVSELETLKLVIPKDGGVDLDHEQVLLVKRQNVALMPFVGDARLENYCYAWYSYLDQDGRGFSTAVKMRRVDYINGNWSER